MAAGTLIALGSTSLDAATINVACPGQSIQTAVNSANPGDVIQVTGACSENVLFRNEKQRVTVNGGGSGQGGAGGATIAGAAGSPTFNIRGKGILIQGFSSISGGSRGIHVNRGSNAVIDQNTIQNTGAQGILFNQESNGVVTSNIIQNNPQAGITVSETSSVRVGSNSFDDNAVSAPNLIQNNGTQGVVVTRGSSARIVSNTITGNGDDGILVTRSSHADTGSNVINSNARSGVAVTGNSTLNLGEDNPVDFLDQPNTTNPAAKNAEYGIRCNAGGLVSGHLGTVGSQLDGVIGQFGSGTVTGSFSGSCPNTPANLQTP
jgi:parallel beta-helix repeat protein